MTTSLRISRLGVALACGLLWLGCGGGHDDGFRDITPEDCSACHIVEYQSTSQPPHSALIDLGYRPELCADCHGSKNWRPPERADLHPENAFSITTPPHNGYACSDCHDPVLDIASAAGQNTSCVGCHTRAHTLDVMDAVHAEDPDYPITGDHANPNFCLECHPDGRFDE
jgi:hypothetical protein